MPLLLGNLATEPLLQFLRCGTIQIRKTQSDSQLESVEWRFYAEMERNLSVNLEDAAHLEDATREKQ